jgi:PPM family protein phosphatase
MMLIEQEIENGVLPAGLDIGSATDVGRVRESNEDALLTLPHPSGQRVLVAVADGMGGHNAGEVASAIAVESLQRIYSAASSTPLEHAIAEANQNIWQAASEDIAKDGMGTTLVCAIVDASGEISLANVGDSRAYAVSGGQARLVTIDHTWVTDQVRAGQMSPEDARISPYRNLLTRSLGAQPLVQVDVFDDLRLESGDALVLCSDGVTTYLDARDVSHEVAAAASAQDAAERLVKLAVRRGGADNATAVVVRRT